MAYETEHADALEAVEEDGAVIVFSKRANDGSTSTVSGSAVGVPGDPRAYSALGLIGRDPVTLLFVPKPRTDGDPPLGATATWGGRKRTVRSSDVLSPDGGDPILATVVLE